VRNRVRQLRTDGSLSQGQLASAVGVSRQTINSIEQERYTPSLPLALSLARFFRRAVEEIFDADDSDSSQLVASPCRSRSSSHS